MVGSPGSVRPATAGRLAKEYGSPPRPFAPGRWKIGPPPPPRFPTGAPPRENILPPPRVPPMPIPVSCPSCSATFRVKDEYAGKRAKCPKCGEPLTIPTAIQAAETLLEPPSVPAQPVAAGPASAGRPKSAQVPTADE